MGVSLPNNKRLPEATSSPKKKIIFCLFLLLFGTIFLQSAEASITASVSGCYITFTATYDGPSSENGYGCWGIIPCDIDREDCDSSIGEVGCNRVNSMVISETVWLGGFAYLSGATGIAVEVFWYRCGGCDPQDDWSVILPFNYSYCQAPCTDNDGDGHTTCRGDCNDNDATIYPNAQEICNGADNNCNGQVDEGVLNTYYQDADGDGFGNPAVTIQACTPPQGYVTDNTDCNDNDPLVYPENGVCCPVPHLTPLTDPLAIRMEGGDRVIFDGLTTEMRQAVGCFENAISNAEGTFTITSAYRPPQYQQHLWEVWNRYDSLIYNRSPECSELRNQIIEEFTSHQLLRTQEPAIGRSSHSDGIAIDANISLPVEQNEDTIANNCELYRPLPQTDPGHFQLRR